MDDSSLIQAREHARIGSARYAKRKYDTLCSCKKCKTISVQSDKCISYACRKGCGVNSVEEAHQRYLDGDYVQEASKSRPDLGVNFKPVDSEYSKLRDEYEIRADLFSKGQTRDSMGPQNFNRKLKKELQHEKCYRGERATGV